MAPDESKKLEFNQDELQAPKWMNNDFFENLLRQYEKHKSIEVRNVTTSPATMKGDHYASVMFRCNVEYQQNGSTKSKSLIVKTLPDENCKKKEKLGESHIFETEIGMYAQIIPRMEEILKNAGDHVILGPLCIYHSLSPRKCLVLEDIVPKGYITQRERPLNDEEIKMVYGKIAKWHAVSYKIALEEPTYFQEYRHHLFELPSFLESALIKNGCSYFISMLQTQTDLSKYISDIEDLKHVIVGKCAGSFNEYLCDHKANAMYVLCHGDFHSKNLMLKYKGENQKVEDVLLHDFQFCYMGPIAMDLIYSMQMMLYGDLQLHRREELLYFYFTNFQETLKKLGHKGAMPKIVDFYKQLMDHRIVELFFLIFFRPMWHLMTDGTVDFEEMQKNLESLKPAWFREKYIEDVRKLLPKYLHKGYLEP